MRAVQFAEYGDPDVLRVAEVEAPHAGPGQIRIAVRAASINPIDWKKRSGMLAEMMPLELPVILGNDASGVVDEVGVGLHLGLEQLADVRRPHGVGDRTS